MTRFLTLSEILTLHERLGAQSGGGIGVRDLGLLESAIAQPKQSFDGSDLYASIPEKGRCWAFRSSPTTRSWTGTSGLAMRHSKRF